MKHLTTICGRRDSLYLCHSRFFDHVAPVTAPARTPGEYVTATAVPDPTVVGNPPINGRIGLGFRVPMLIISPFSRGGFVASDLFDHTSVLRFLETLFGAEVPNLSAWSARPSGISPALSISITPIFPFQPCRRLCSPLNQQFRSASTTSRERLRSQCPRRNNFQLRNPAVPRARAALASCFFCLVQV